MTGQMRPSEAKKAVQSNSSRAVAIGAVALLIVVAIAGIVLAGRKSADPAVAGPAVVPATTQPVASAPTADNPNEVVFAPGSPKMPATASESIARFAESARSSGSNVRISVRYLTGENKARDRDLSSARATAIREALLGDGIGAAKMQVEVIEMPTGSLTDADANRADLTMR